MGESSLHAVLRHSVKVFVGQEKSSSPDLWLRLAPAGSGVTSVGRGPQPSRPPGPAGGVQGLSPWEGGARSVGLGDRGGWHEAAQGLLGAATWGPRRAFLGRLLSPLARRCFLPSHRPQWLQVLELPVPLSRLGQAAPRSPRGTQARKGRHQRGPALGSVRGQRGLQMRNCRFHSLALLCFILLPRVFAEARGLSVCAVGSVAAWRIGSPTRG